MLMKRGRDAGLALAITAAAAAVSGGALAEVC